MLKLIKSYFFLYNNKLEKRIRQSNIRKRFRRLSSSRIYISNGYYKHTNNKVIITLYVYNRQKINYTYLIKRKFKLFFKQKLIKNILRIKLKIEKLIMRTEINKIIVFKLLRTENNDLLLAKLKNYSENLYYKLLIRVHRKYKKYFLYKQLLYINESKFNYNYLSVLSALLKKIYNKNVQFDIINLKYFYLNSDIFLQSILLKIKRDRKRLIRKLKYLVTKSKINKVSKFISYNPKTKNTANFVNGTDPVNYLVFENSLKNKKTIKKTVLSSIKYKTVTGVRLEAKGRLTKRYTASRSMSRLRYKGNLVNIDSSYLGLSSVLLRGNLRSNLQYTKLKSKTRIGSFGLKG